MTLLISIQQEDTTENGRWGDSLNGIFCRNVFFLHKHLEDKSGNFQWVIFQTMASMFRDHVPLKLPGTYHSMEHFVAESIVYGHERHVLELISKHEEFNIDP